MPLEPFLCAARAIFYLLGNFCGGLGLVFLAASFTDGRLAAQAIGFILLAVLFDLASHAGSRRR